MARAPSRPPSLRIIGGAWRGRALVAPDGQTTRPTAERVRQALFDMLAHAPWSPGLDGLHVLDAFAGSGALAFEALSRGAASVSMFDTDRAAQAAIRRNVDNLPGASARAIFLPVDATRPPRAGRACDLVFLDPPYAAGLIPAALSALSAAGWLAPDALIVAETARAAPGLADELLAERTHGAATVQVWRRRDVFS